MAKSDLSTAAISYRQDLAFETRWNGRTYRSQLEARWAAFFEEMGWCAEYEPGNAGLWLPDFVIRTEHQRELYVEVKPITYPDAATQQKMLANLQSSGRMPCDAILLGHMHTGDRLHRQIGWISTEEGRASGAKWSNAYLAAYADGAIGLVDGEVGEDRILKRNEHPLINRAATPGARAWGKAGDAVRYSKVIG